jgi:hypothetical protein
MCPRARKLENQHLPVGLSIRELRGERRYRYRTPEGKEKLFPKATTELEAIETVILHNLKIRIPIDLETFLQDDPYNKPLKYWLPKVQNRVHLEELLAHQIGESAFKDFSSNIDKLTKCHGDVLSKELTLQHVNEFLNLYSKGKSNGVYNKKLSFLKKVFSYLVDEGATDKNLALQKKRKPKDEVERQRLSLNAFKKMTKVAPHFLKIAMQISLQTTHSLNEVTHLKYSDCTWFKKSRIQDGLTVYGVMRIHRQKVKNKEASRVAIPITDKLRCIIEESKSDNIESPYIVHHQYKRPSVVISNKEHPTQVTEDYLTRAFTKQRDELKLYAHLKPSERPTYHEIRALSIHLYDEKGVDPQARAAHTDAESTKLYKTGHVKWVDITAAEIDD